MLGLQVQPGEALAGLGLRGLDPFQAAPGGQQVLIKQQVQLLGCLGFLGTLHQTLSLMRVYQCRLGKTPCSVSPAESTKSEFVIYAWRCVGYTLKPELVRKCGKSTYKVKMFLVS